MFIWNPNDPANKRLLDKLTCAGWVHLSISTDKPNGGEAIGIQWTDDGKRKLAVILSLIREIETASLTLTNDEIQWLKTYAELAEASGGGDETSAPRF